MVRDEKMIWEVNVFLDNFHKSAAEGALQDYLSCFLLDATFIGTDAAECWDFREFERLCAKHFRDGHGWTYVPLERRINNIPGANGAYFYERLASPDYIEARGSGIVLKRGDDWRIAQYVMSFPVPNNLADSLAEQVLAELSKGAS